MTLFQYAFRQNTKSQQTFTSTLQLLIPHTGTGQAYLIEYHTSFGEAHILQTTGPMNRWMILLQYTTLQYLFFMIPPNKFLL